MQNWLTTPTQRLLELTAGEVFVDPIGDLTRVRELLAWYPWGRPFRVLFADRFVDTLRAAITDADVHAISHSRGAIDALSDNSALLEQPDLWRKLTDLYDRA